MIEIVNIVKIILFTKSRYFSLEHSHIGTFDTPVLSNDL